jgi:hypothetical protein
VSALAAVSLAACGESAPQDDGDDARVAATTAAPSVVDSPDPAGSVPADGASTSTKPDRPAPADGGAVTVRDVTISIGGAELAGRLDDTATARDLATQLPLTVVMSDHDGAEKTGPLPRALTTSGAPEGHDPSAGDIGYYAPGGDLVLYYDDAAPYFDGIVRVGRFSGDLDALRGASEVSVRVERSEDTR